MAIWFDVTRVVTVLNVALVLSLGYVWLRNYLRLRTGFTVGFLAFGAFMLAENGVALYMYLLDPTMSGWFAEIPRLYTFAFMVLALLQFGALVALARLTWR